MSLPVYLTPAAESDLIEQYRFIAAQNPDAAERFFDAAEGFFALAAENPRIGTKRDCDRAGTLRMFPVPGFRNWLVLYRPAKGHLLIVRIIHARRDLPSLFGE